MEIKSITKFVTEYVVIEESEYDDEEDSCWWCGNSAGVDTITFPKNIFDQELICMESLFTLDSRALNRSKSLDSKIKGNRQLVWLKKLMVVN